MLRWRATTAVAVTVPAVTPSGGLGESGGGADAEGSADERTDGRAVTVELVLGAGATAAYARRKLAAAAGVAAAGDAELEIGGALVTDDAAALIGNEEENSFKNLKRV